MIFFRYGQHFGFKRKFGTKLSFQRSQREMDPYFSNKFSRCAERKQGQTYLCSGVSLRNFAMFCHQLLRNCGDETWQLLDYNKLIKNGRNRRFFNFMPENTESRAEFSTAQREDLPEK